MTVDVIVATYNGEKYLKEQLHSILNQTYKDIRVLIRDDNSTDATVSIIRDIARLDSRVIFIQDDISPNGVGENFKNLLKNCTADYVLLADQDDVWLDTKIEKLLSFSKRKFNNNIPSIAYSPGVVVDEELNRTDRLTSYTNGVNSIADIFLTNGGVQGCSMIVNKALYNMALKSDFFWYMHDQVLTLYAVSFGEVFFMNEPLFLYRQHQANVIGYNNSKCIDKLRRYFPLWNDSFVVSRQSNDLFHFFYRENECFLSERNKKIFEVFFSLSTSCKISNIKKIIKYRLKLNNSVSMAVVKSVLCVNFNEKNDAAK